MTFHAFSRARRLGHALASLKDGEAVTQAAFSAGYESLAGFNEAFRQFAGRTASRSHDALVVHVDRLETALGPMIAAATATELVMLEFADRRMLPTQVGRLVRHFDCVFVPARSEVLKAAQCQLDEFFARRRQQFTVPIAFPGTPFQLDVWQALLAIPPGETRSYQQVAAIIGKPQAVRAVARANGDNRIAIIIPCHRVIGADGKLTGYGGGLWRKRRLLELEGCTGV
jgi:AraC family transcriptional regulator of adaptative response/methylated-DNA-[protein]-cysteine methyltransferase